MVHLRDPERCPRCSSDSKVVDSRRTVMARKRRRACLACAYRWNTYESLIDPQAVRLTDANHHKM